MKHFLLFLLLIAANTIHAQPVKNSFNAAFQKFLADPDYKHATVSLFVTDLTSGKSVTEYLTQTGLAPASTQKVVTAATAYHLLGADFRYETRVGYTGKLENGRLTGNIIIKGSGDPTLGSWRYDDTKEERVINEIVAAVKQAGISELDGHVLIDEHLFDDEVIPDGWTWQDIGNYYGAGARALNWRENQFDLYLRSGAEIGSLVAIAGTKPEYISRLNLESKLKAAPVGTGDHAYIYLPMFYRKGFVRGTIPVNQNKFSISGTMPEPGRQMAMTIEGLLKKQSLETIDANYPANAEAAYGSAQDIYTIESPSLDSICYWFLQKSINLYGEALLKTLGKRFGKSGSTSEGVKVVQDFWAKNGIDAYALNINDGSGLSPQNRITTDDLVKVLLFAKKQPWYSGFYKGIPTINGIKMKSGSIGGVISYTGYLPGKSGNYVFAFIVNNYNGTGNATRRKMWKLLDVLK